MLGRKIGHYRVTRLIGKGGMGLVYEAVHEEIERRAAIKLLLPQFTNDAEATSRFLNEVRARVRRREIADLDDQGTAAKRQLGFSR